MLLKYVRYILIPSVNYGAYSDPEEMEDLYLHIDEKIACFAKEILFDIPSKEQTRKLLIEPHETGGL